MEGEGRVGEEQSPAACVQRSGDAFSVPSNPLPAEPGAGQAGVVHADESFPRRCRLGGNRYYRYVYRKGKSYPSKDLVLIHLKGKEQRFGFSVSAKVGNAVTRNRIRRYMREDVRRMRRQLKSGKYIFIARPTVKTLAHTQLTRELEKLLCRAKLMKEEEGQ